MFKKRAPSDLFTSQRKTPKSVIIICDGLIKDFNGTEKLERAQVLIARRDLIGVWCQSIRYLSFSFSLCTSLSFFQMFRPRSLSSRIFSLSTPVLFFVCLLFSPACIYGDLECCWITTLFLNKSIYNNKKMNSCSKVPIPHSYIHFRYWNGSKKKLYMKLYMN